MSNNQINKGNQKGGAQDQRRKKNEKRDAENNEQSSNDKKHLQQGQPQPRGKVGTATLPAGGSTGK